jgi:hypothetical protein
MNRDPNVDTRGTRSVCVSHTVEEPSEPTITTAPERGTATEPAAIAICPVATDDRREELLIRPLGNSMRCSTPSTVDATIVDGSVISASGSGTGTDQSSEPSVGSPVPTLVANSPTSTTNHSIG